MNILHIQAHEMTYTDTQRGKERLPPFSTSLFFFPLDLYYFLHISLWLKSSMLYSDCRFEKLFSTWVLLQT